MFYMCVFCARRRYYFKEVFENIFAIFKKYAMLFGLCFSSTWLSSEKINIAYI